MWVSLLGPLPCFIGVNLKSGRYFRSLALLAVFLNWPSDLEVSYLARVKVVHIYHCNLLKQIKNLSNMVNVSKSKILRGNFDSISIIWNSSYRNDVYHNIYIQIFIMLRIVKFFLGRSWLIGQMLIVVDFAGRNKLTSRNENRIIKTAKNLLNEGRVKPGRELMTLIQNSALEGADEGDISLSSIMINKKSMFPNTATCSFALAAGG